jgi:hypothetical protein
MDNVPSVLMCVGRKYYKLYQIINEAYNAGVSKRIPANTIPEGLEVGVSKIFLAHPDAIVKVNKPGCILQDLAYDLVQLEAMTQTQFMKLVDVEKPYWTGHELNAEDFVPECMLDVAIALSTLPDEDHQKMVEKYNLEFCMGIFGFSFFGGFQYVCRPNEDELPVELSHLEGYVEPVHVVYENESTEEEDVADAN